MRSVRSSGRVVQETVAHLGELDAAGRPRGLSLALQVTGGADEQQDLFEHRVRGGASSRAAQSHSRGAHAWVSMKCGPDLVGRAGAGCIL
jgi:hypothetical protein